MPEGQVFPHAPQFNSSLLISVHAPLQDVKPFGHEHTPLTQSFPNEQTFPHLPQFLKSKLVSVHVPLQRASPGKHEQLPLMQAFPTAQMFPHVPQFSSSTLVSVHDPLHRLVPTGHVELFVGSARLSINPKANSNDIMYIILILPRSFYLLYLQELILPYQLLLIISF